MQVAKIIGSATSTVKHPTMIGWRMVVAQPLDHRGEPDEFPIVAIDNLGSSVGDTVIVTSDGKSVREMIGSPNTPVRWAVIGLADDRS
ncbi:MAG: EutN/CcmL family microcompartment protein [Planctomycetota bacterium]|nr:EutN/CcmL family microcompartment protein [Planctomycetota bacterium]MDA1211472.1 EutN/CcmL family microcompartment protein [Planctomycetota bacterium]